MDQQYIELFDINKVNPDREYLPDWPGLLDDCTKQNSRVCSNKQALHVNLLDDFTQLLDQRRHMQRIALSLRHVSNHSLHHSTLNPTLHFYEIDVVSEGELTFPEDG